MIVGKFPSDKNRMNPQIYPGRTAMVARFARKLFETGSSASEKNG
jgi:hypothetical protein